FAEHWFPDGTTPAALRVAPMLSFDRKDDMQDRALRRVTRARLEPPRNYVPGALEFVDAVRLGLGWGMLPEPMLTDTTGMFRLDLPRNSVPGALELVDPVRLGLGCGMLPDPMLTDTTGLVRLDPGRPFDVPMYWQRWKLESPVLDSLTEAVRRTAREVLR